MPIESICKGCARKLRVGDEFAGRQARCPHCKTVYTVPGLTTSLRAESDEWSLRAEDGSIYGPVPKADLDQWLAEGRVTAESQLRRGASDWVAATEVYPSLTQAKVAAGVNPFCDQETRPLNPYASPAAQNPFAGRPQTRYRPHRGGFVLTFGILSWVACTVCGIIGPIFGGVAWALGRADLAAIRSGDMDPAGQGMTQAGMILGMVNCIVGGIGIIAYIGFIVIIIISEGM